MTAKLLLQLISAAMATYNASMQALDALKKNSEMTPEEEAEYDALVEERMKSPHWQRSQSKQPPPAP